MQDGGSVSSARDEDARAPKRKVPPSLKLGGESDNEEEEKRLKVRAENVKCSICLNIWHDVVSLTPCQHNFCNGCFSEWYRSSRRGGTCICPQCRTSVLYVGRNHAMRSVVEDMIASDPTLRRPPDETAKLDKSALVKSNFMQIADLSSTRPVLHIPPPPPPTYQNFSSDSSSGSGSGSGSDEDEDDDDGPNQSCRQCLDNTTSFKCLPGAAHLSCSACFQKMPERNDIAVSQKCACCGYVFCDQYWRSQNLPGCTASKLQPISERQVPIIPRETHKLNTVEQQFTKEYLDQHGLTIEGVVKDWMTKVDNAEIALTNTGVRSTSPVCNNCANNIVAQLLDKFRMSIPKNELPPAAAQRQDCWYGHACRTQRKQPHAIKLNHVCEPTSTQVQLR